MFDKITKRTTYSPKMVEHYEKWGIAEGHQWPPLWIHIELVEGCAQRCPGCGIQAIRRGSSAEMNFMHWTTLKRIKEEIYRLGWHLTTYVVLSGRGEPTKHPQFLDLVGFLRKSSSLKLILQTSGEGLVHKNETLANTAAIFSAGLNVLRLTDHPSMPFYAVFEDLADLIVATTEAKVLDWPGRNLEAAPWNHRIHYRQKFFVFDENNEGRENLGGCGAPPAQNRATEVCDRPFREMYLRWNGEVQLCQADWRSKYVVGDVKTNTLDNLWNSMELQAARRHLWNTGRRGIMPCDGCDYVARDPKLLPDPTARGVVLPRSELSKEIVEAMNQNPCSSPTATLPWERYLPTRSG